MTYTAPPTLGDKAQDVVTGFTGVVTGEARYITGCTQLLLQPQIRDDGSKAEGVWIDIDRLQVMETQVVKLAAHADVDARTLATSSPGADDPAPIR